MTCLTDPACGWSWAAEPAVRRLMTEFDGELRFTWRMGGLAREFPRDEQGRLRLAMHWLDISEQGRMPVDPRLWIEGPLGSSYPAGIAVRAAAQQADDGGYAYLRRLREGIFCFRRKLDTTEALVEAAREAGLDVARFRIDLGSHATLEEFGADLEAARDVPGEAREQDGVTVDGEQERLTFPSMVFEGEDGTRRGLYGSHPYEACREAAEAAGARPSAGPRPDVPAALRRFGRMAAAEVEAVCDLPEPRAGAELWRLASEWRARPIRVLTGELWEPA